MSSEENILLPMKFTSMRIAALVTWLALALVGVPGALAPAAAAGQLTEFSEYFRVQTAAIEQTCLAGVHSLSDWSARRELYRRQLREMLGLEPLPPRTDLQPVITGRLERDVYTVERLHFQAMPQLYVTANLYLPKGLSGPAPAILYVCGHARMLTNGISCGNKTGYQHHGDWFARHGYVCLMIDTLQLGEIEGLHHGTYRENQWWWNSRGYTPAGVEAWFGMRALDYLCSRPEVDRERIGMTGRSGGGAYTWTVAALDERVKVAAPVAGITDLRNQVVDGVVEGHCDCMFFVNTYRWDFPQLAALLAPRPLLIANSDKDTIFPLEGVVRVHNQTRRIYNLYGAGKNLGLLITEGPHADTQDLQLPVFRWFNRFLKREDPLIESAAKKVAAPASLRVFEQLPADQLNTRIQEQFVPVALCLSEGAGSAGNPVGPAVIQQLRDKVFGGWPGEPFVFIPMSREDHKWKNIRCRSFEFGTQRGIDLTLYLLTVGGARPDRVVLTVLDSPAWTNCAARAVCERQPGASLTTDLLETMAGGKTALAFFAPRGVEPGSWSTNRIKFNHVRRRYMLLGQTLDSMRVWDIRCAVQAIRSLPGMSKASVALRSSGYMGVNACYAALFEPAVESVEAEALPASHRDGPDYLNVLKVWDIPQMLEALGERWTARPRN